MLPTWKDDGSERSRVNEENKVDGFEFTHGENFHKKSLVGEANSDEAILEEVSVIDFQKILRELGFLLYDEDDESDLAYQ